jgi:KDO2-lipid IV(A) lauroyltransferase
VKQRIEYLMVRLLIAVVRITPYPVIRTMGTFAGVASYVLDAAHRRVALRNLAAAFPARSPAERRTIARAAFF